MASVRTNGKRIAATVGDVMAPIPLTVAAGSSIADAARLMRAWDVPDVLVTDRGRLVGTLPEREVVVLAIASDAPPSAITSGEACDTASPRLRDDQLVGEALEMMRSQQLGYVPVLDRRGRLLGCVWRADVEAAAAALPAAPPRLPAPPLPPAHGSAAAAEDQHPWRYRHRAAHEPAQRTVA